MSGMRPCLIHVAVLALLGLFGAMGAGKAQFTVVGYYPDPIVANQYDVIGSGLSQVTKMTISPYSAAGDVNAVVNFTLVSDQELTFVLDGTLSNYIDLTFSNPNYSVIGVTLVNTAGRFNIPLTTIVNGQTLKGGQGGSRVLVMAGGSYGNGGGGSNVEFVQNGGTFTGNSGGGSNTTYFEPYAFGSNSTGGGGGDNYIEVNSIVVLPAINPNSIISGSTSSTNTITLSSGTTTVTGSNSTGYGLLSLTATGTTTLFNYIGSTGTLTAAEIVIASGGTAIIQNSGGGVLTLPGINENGGILELSNGKFIIVQSISGTDASDPVIDGSTVGYTVANSYGGATSIIHGGTLLTATTGALPTSTYTSLTLGATNDGGAGQTNSLDLLGTSQTVGSLTSVGPNVNQVVSSNGSANGTPALGTGGSPSLGNLTVNYSGATADTYSGSLGSGSLNHFGLTKAGSGNVILSGANTYAGPTTILAGTLSIHSNLSSTSSVSIAAGSTLNVTNAALTTAGTITNTGTLVLGNGASLASSGTFTNQGTLDLTAAPSFVLPANFVNKGVVLNANGTVSNAGSTATDTPTMPQWALMALLLLLFSFATPSLIAGKTSKHGDCSSHLR